MMKKDSKVCELPKPYTNHCVWTTPDLKWWKPHRLKPVFAYRRIIIIFPSNLASSLLCVVPGELSPPPPPPPHHPPTYCQVKHVHKAKNDSPRKTTLPLGQNKGLRERSSQTSSTVWLALAVVLLIVLQADMKRMSSRRDTNQEAD